MSHEFTPPTVQLDGRPLACRQVEIRQPSGGPPRAEIECPLESLPPGPPRPLPLEIAHEGRPLFSGTVSHVQRHVTGDGGRLVAATPALRLWQPTSFVFPDLPPSDAVQRIATAAGLRCRPAPPGGGRGRQIVSLADVPATLVARLCLTQGLLPIYRADAAELQLADLLSGPGTPAELRAEDLLGGDLQQGVPPRVEVVAPRLAAVGEYQVAIAKSAGDSVIRIELPEAITEGELKAAAQAIQKLYEFPGSHVIGDSDLLTIDPGEWITCRDSSPLLVTGRDAIWTRGGGWHVHLHSGLATESLARRPLLPTSGVLLGRDKSGRLRVRLAKYDDVEIAVLLAAELSSEKQFSGSLPRPAMVGEVSFLDGVAEWGVWEHCVAAPERITAQDYDRHVQMLVTEKAESTIDQEGNWHWKFAGHLEGQVTGPATFQVGGDCTLDLGKLLATVVSVDVNEK